MTKAADRLIAELEHRAADRNADWETIAPQLPADPRARVAALATVLGIDALAALRGDVPLDVLEHDREALRESADAAVAVMRAAGVDPFEPPEA